MSIEVMIVDWPHVEAVPPGEREAALIDAAFGGEDDPYGAGDGQADEDEDGWLAPAAPGAGWSVRYSFRRTLDSYKPHFWAGERWERLREHTDPDLRTALDRFASRLFWTGLEDVPGQDTGLRSVPEGAWDAGLLVWCPPAELAALAGWWRTVEPGLATLREPFTRYAADRRGWIPDHDSFADLLTGWGEVVTEAHRRGWGIVGLRC
ncbi:hypothetical protein [Streptomyces sp. NPDC015131]|uniref:hypothetical protein n=1 Tax=Streptomyces sp. NPDC015131 TaxID=3364941 RepID=UPI0037013163